MDSYVLLSLAAGGAPTLVQPFRNGNTGYVQPIWLAFDRRLTC
jgi:hypothetical protein